ncbi:hypothetical protein FBUS_10702 [Fasciolopsis buskii]|uniref:Uncharacterized protein n=1 Tax=Fasciolopsis buskii TaxID=27845 RepID=A0A8E0S135_9TREM|nr:hypothetical protein FBUS_10702 [Fasciolopsis buski]
MTNGSVVGLTATGLLDGESKSTVIEMIVERKAEEENVALDRPMQANCSDVYPGDVVHLNAFITHSEKSNRECDSMVLILHNGPWVNHVTVLVNGNETNSNVTGDLRLKVIRTKGLLFGGNLTLTSDVYFANKIDLHQGVKLRLISFTLEIMCKLGSRLRGNDHVYAITTTNVVLHTARANLTTSQITIIPFQIDAYQNLIVPMPVKAKDCRVTTWRTDYQPQVKHRELTESLKLGESPKMPYITLSMGRMCRFYYLRLNLTTTDESSFKVHVSMTRDGRSFTPVDQVPFALHYNHTYSCVFNRPILASGLLIIPLDPVIKHRIATDAVHLFGNWHEQDSHRYGEYEIWECN